MQLIPLLDSHQAFSARQMGWDQLTNGELLATAHKYGFHVMVTGDKNLTYQQNNSKRSIAIVLISNTKRRLILADANLIHLAIDRSEPGGFELVSIRRVLKPFPVE